ncbi:unnamed protein product [Closterium sp. NIES-54]
MQRVAQSLCGQRHLNQWHCSLSPHGMVNLALMARVVHVDKGRGGTGSIRSTAYPSPLFLAALSPFSCFQELEKIVQAAHREGRPIRPVGSAISPNGIALSAHGMVNLALMDRVVHVDKSTGRVRMQAGARVEQVVEALRPHGLTLQNYASVREQQIGGFIQVSSRGCIG